MAQRNEQDRPVHLVINLAEGTETYVPLSDAEWDEYEQRGLDSQQAERERLAQEQADHDLIRQEAQTSPAFAALARVQGIKL